MCVFLSIPSHKIVPPPGLWCYRVDADNVAVGGIFYMKYLFKNKYYI